MRILVTGASGHLGRPVVKALRAKGHEVVGTYHSHPRPGLRPLDVTDAEACAACVRETAPDAIVHSAADRDPDSCARDPERATRLNVASTAHLLDAMDPGTLFLFVSSDYVFDGEHAPYREDDERRPINHYGRTKVESEDLVRARAREWIATRIPWLYGVNDREEATVLTKTAKLVLAGTPVKMDHVAARYPTYIGDVAAAIAHLVDVGFRGPVHLTGPEKTTKYELTRRMAGWLGRDPSFVAPDRAPVTPAPRPRDCHLATETFRAAGGAPFRGFSEVMPGLLRELGYDVAP